MEHRSRSVVCYAIYPISVRCYIRLRLTTVRSGTALRFLPERQILFAKQYYICCAGWAAGQIQRQNGQRADGVDPKVKIKSIEDLINSDPNCDPEAKAFFSPNLFFTYLSLIMETSFRAKSAQHERRNRVICYVIDPLCLTILSGVLMSYAFRKIFKYCIRILCQPKPQQ